MRFKQNELIIVQLLEQDGETSDYVGTIPKWKSVGEYQCNSQQADNSINVELYGVKVSDMKTLYFLPDVSINKKCGIAYDLTAEKPEFYVVSIKEYSTHKVVLVSREKR